VRLWKGWNKTNINLQLGARKLIVSLPSCTFLWLQVQGATTETKVINVTRETNVAKLPEGRRGEVIELVNRDFRLNTVLTNLT